MDKLLSLCMIVKDEEKVLKTCLESLKDIVDEIIIVDTGSTDQTKQIAYQYTQQVYDYTWSNDFSAARNVGLKNATGKWILIMDADEYVEIEEFKSLRQALHDLDHTLPICLTVPIYSFVGTSSEDRGTTELPVERIFSNLPSISYTRPLHEKIVCSTGNFTYIKSDFRVYHTGYLDEIRKEKDKSNRNLAIFKTMLSQKEHIPYDMFSLANEYYVDHQYKKAEYYFQRAYQRASKNEPWFFFCMHQYIFCLIELDKYKDAVEFTDEAIQRWAKHPEFYTIRGAIYQRFGFFDMAKQEFETAIEISERSSANKEDYWLISPDYGSIIPYQKLSENYLNRFDIQQAIYYLTKMLQIKPKNPEVLFKLVSILIQNQNTEDIIRILSLIYTNFDLTTLTLLLEVSLLTGNKELVEYYYKQFENNHLSLTERQILRYALLTNNQTLFNQLGFNNDVSINDGKICILAACVWKDTSYLNLITSENSEWYLIKEIIHSRLNNIVESPDSNIINIFNLIIPVLTDLFRTGQYEAYDWLIQQFPSNKQEIANHLGDYFFENFYFDLAIDYYSTLDPDQSNSTAFVNLGKLCIHQGLLQDGLVYLTKAITKSQELIQIYTLRCISAVDPSEREKFKSELMIKFPQYKNLPFIKNL